MSCATWFDIATIDTGEITGSEDKLRSIIGRCSTLEYKIRDVVIKVLSGQPLEEEEDSLDDLYYVPTDYIDAFLYSTIGEAQSSSGIVEEDSGTPSIDHGVYNSLRIFYGEPIDTIDLFNAEMNSFVFGELIEGIRTKGFDPSKHNLNIIVDIGQHTSGTYLAMAIMCSWV